MGCAESGITAPLPTLANPIHDATGVWMTQSPFTAEREWHALQDTGEGP
jgi:CO/xanthine dehydrogenase Mo-binding subunit